MQNCYFEDPQFQKLFEFERTHERRLPDTVYRAPHFEIQELQNMKRELNAVKGKLSQFDLTEWSLHTRNRDVAGYVIGQLRKQIGPELLTHAWCKFYEIASMFPVVRPKETGFFRSVHLCEAPGAFICALKHYLVLRYPDVHWQWHANTLNPDYEGNPVSQMISDDSLICYTRDSWLFGRDLTGDIQQYYNHIDIVSKITAFEGKVDLITADGSIDCMSDPGEQEKLVQFLHYCETITALAVLNAGGSFVLKIFTIFEESTVCLLYLLNCIFDKTFLFKPCTSKSGNSELYLVCIGFNGLDVLGSIWETLVGPYRNGFFNKNVSMFSLDDISNSFIRQLKSCCSDFFLEKQINTINTNIYHFQSPNNAEKRHLHSRKIIIANYYIKKYQLKRIPSHKRVVSYINIHINQKYLGNSIESHCFCLKDWCSSSFVNVCLGKRIDVVHNSKFASVDCIQNLIKHLKNKNQALPSLYNLIVHMLEKKATVINVKEFNLTPYHKFQKELFTSIQAALGKEKHILFINVPFHTHFLAALWSILASTFENVYFDRAWCLFYNPVVAKVPSSKNIFRVIENTYSNVGNTSLFPQDITYVFQPNVFYNDLDFVPDVLKVCNSFQVPLK